MKKIIALVLVLCLLLAACAEAMSPAADTLTDPETTGVPATASTQATEETRPAAQVCLLDPNGDHLPVWQSLAGEFTQQTGTTVTVLTAADGRTPTIFTAGTQEAEALADQCLNLSGQAICTQLLGSSFALRSGDKILGIAAETEFFGLVYNTSLLARAGYTRADIQTLDDLAAIAADITANRDTLGFAAFACPDLSDCSDHSFSALFGSVSSDLRRFWDIHVENAACSRKDIAACTTSAGLEELLRGEAVFYLAGTADYDKFQSFQDYEIAMLPLIYESSGQCLCAVDTSYWCVHAEAPEQDIQAALEFLTWLVSPREDGTVPVDDLQMFAPYRQAAFVANPLEAAIRTELGEGRQVVVCAQFTGSVETLAQALAAYAAAPTDANWAAVAKALQ